jgi:hypothetical protein
VARVDPPARGIKRRLHFSSQHMQLSARDPGAASRPLWFAVPKKLLPRAVDRNAFRRVGREAWRQHAGPSMAGLLKLRAVNPLWKAQSLIARKKGWRAEIDALVQQFALQSAP